VKGPAWRWRLPLPGLLVAVWLTTGAAGASEPPRLAMFDFELVDTSLVGESRGIDPADQARLAMVQEELRAALKDSGRYDLVDTAPAAAAIRNAGYLWSCNGCELGIARQLDADLALVGWVQKVSNLMLNLNVVVRDATTRAPVLAGSVDMRGDTDESWRHAIRYLIQHRLLRAEP
jgi:Protein of unknown function (DUF2380)